MFFLILTQTLTHAFRKGGGAFGALGFYIIVVTLFTFALGPDAARTHAAAVMAVAMLLSVTTALPLFFERDEADGTLEQYLLQPAALEWIVLAKMLGHLLAVAGPMLTLSPLIALLADLSASHLSETMALLVLASPSIVAVSALAAALTLGARHGGLLQALITLPLMIPVLIFAASVDGQGAMWFLAGMACVLTPLAAWVCAALIKVSVE